MPLGDALRARWPALALAVLCGCGRMAYEARPDATDVDLAEPDQRAPDLSTPDLAAPDLAVGDLATPDLAAPDLAAPDLATLDLVALDLATPDLATPDLAAPDLATPDLARPDLATPDLVKPPDLTAPTCVDGIKNGSETDVDCGGACGKCADLKRCDSDAGCQSGMCNAHRCTAVITLATGSPLRLAAGDLDGDGRLDLAVAHHLRPGGRLGVLLGKGGATFAAEVLYQPSQDAATGVTIADYDGDGKPDVAMCNYGPDYSGSNVDLFSGRGDGTFAAVQAFATGDSNAMNMASGDLDGDGKQDLAIVHNNGQWSLTLMRQVAGPTLQRVQAIPSTTSGLLNPRVVAFGDLDRDGRSDVVASAWNTGVGTFRNTGGMLSFQQRYLTGRNSNCPVGIGDLDGDGDLDLVAADCPTESKAAVLLNKGDGTFLAGGQFAVGPGAEGLAIVDLDGDGPLDLVTSSNSTAELTLLRGVGDGTFGAETRLAVRGNPRSVIAADLDGDGSQDLIAVGFSTGTISVLLSPGLP